MLRRSRRAQEHRQSGEIGERITEDAECEIVVPDALDEPVDHFARTAHEERLIGDQTTLDRHAFALEKEHQVGRREDRHRTAGRTHRLAATEGEKIGVARTESDDAQHGPDRFDRTPTRVTLSSSKGRHNRRDRGGP